MIGTIANASTILVGSIIGSTLRKGFDEKYKNIMMDSMGLDGFHGPGCHGAGHQLHRAGHA